MADLSDFTSVFRARVNLSDKRKANKRNRQTLSCLACRARKLKCDRQNPCGACAKRGEGPSCSFVGAGAAIPSSSNGISKTSTSHGDTKKSEAQARLQKLEELVQQLIQSGSSAESGNAGGQSSTSRSSGSTSDTTSRDEDNTPQLTPASSNNATASPPILMSYNENSGAYVGATHWAALLDRIQGLKESLGMPPDENLFDIAPEDLADDFAPGTEDVDLILGSSNGLRTVEEAFSLLPSKLTCDRLMATYYSSKFSNTLFIHTHKFRREYEGFWEKPPSRTLIWMSTLYSILCLGSLMATRCGKYLGVAYSDIDPSKLLIKSRQCLVAGNHSKAQPYIIESLLCYMYCKGQLQDRDDSLWALSGYVTRFAQRLGYHRDPKHLGNKFTPFESEMRRRTWFWVTTFDLIFSFQYGMPSIIHDEQCDTQTPSNISDEEFDEDSVVLPPPRPATEYSHMLYFHHKVELTIVFRKVIRVALALKPPEYDEILKLDKELDEVMRRIPPTLRFSGRIRDSSFADASYLILHRIVLELSYHKGRCVLHRSYLTYQRDDPQYQYSRDRCRESAIRILDLQADAHEESQPGGRLWEERWMIETLTLHDFLLASMIMCLDLSELRRQGSADPADYSGHCISTLRKSHKIWSENKHMSREALHASTLLGQMLAHISERERARERGQELTRTAAIGRRALGDSIMVQCIWSPTANPEPAVAPESAGAGSSKGQGQGTLTPIASAVAGSNGSTYQLLGFDKDDLLSPKKTNKKTSREATCRRLSNKSTAPPAFDPGPPQSIPQGSIGIALQSSPETSREQSARPISPSGQIFDSGFGSLDTPMLAVDAFDPLDFDSFMGGGATVDWGMIDRYLFDQSKVLDFMPPPETGTQSVNGSANGTVNTADVCPSTSDPPGGGVGHGFFC